MDRAAKPPRPGGSQTILDSIALARGSLVAAGFTPDDAALDAEVLARDVLGWDRARLLVDGRAPAGTAFTEAYNGAVNRRLAHEPVALITGHREFWGLDFLVTPATLIPRPETEIVVEEALRILTPDSAALVLDVGTGSGCLAVALAHERPGIVVGAIDLSHAALLVARSNARRLGVARRIHFIQADLVSSLLARADLIVSNPPYVPETTASTLPADVTRHEPSSALFGGADGLSVIRRLLATVSGRLAPGGRLIVEFGFGQETAVREIAREHGWLVDRVVNDLQGLARTIVLGR